MNRGRALLGNMSSTCAMPACLGNEQLAMMLNTDDVIKMLKIFFLFQLNKVKDDLVFAKSENSDLKTRFTQVQTAVHGCFC